MDIYAIRKQQLINLIGNQKKGACAERWGMAPAHLSQILSDKTAKNLGDDVARRIEAVEGLPRGWFDALGEAGAGALAPPAQATSQAGDEIQNSTAAELVKKMLAKVKGLSLEARDRIVAAAEEPDESSSSILPANFSSLRPTNEEIIIRQYDIRAAMGHGQVPPDYTEVVRNLVVREEILREKGVSYTSKTALAMISGWGQSMEGTINDKDLVIVDKGVQDFIGDGIYVLTWHQQLYIKRVMRLDEENYRLISDNQHYENQTARIDDVTIHAKVLLIWNARKA
ncbi:S24 family peptidase [Pseudomonas sp. CFBP 8772]|uniref:S24 family peptidase n=1 Tax=Pseudomonas sp. CFBP 8772 TaxID=2775284 RepID=UPI0017876E87|nr:S24 family peptidase [Pseudomonas sp. CFBP 8772]MBD8597346.1 LexA family transcriptional regulator [Pseudomonas sp. CFBP 8772]